MNISPKGMDSFRVIDKIYAILLNVTGSGNETSCGMSVPFYDYLGERTELYDWAEKQGKEGLQQYWGKKINLAWMAYQQIF